MNEPIDEKTKAELAKQGLVAVRRQDAESHVNCLLGSLLLTIGIAFASFYWGGRDLNNFWWIAPLLILGGIVPATVSGLLRRSWKKGLGVLFFSMLFPTMITVMLGFTFGMVLTDLYGQAPRLTQFAQEDFARYERPGTGVVWSDDLQKIIDKQNLLRNDKVRLESLKKELTEVTSVAAATQAQMQGSVDSAEISLSAQMIPDEELARLSTVENASYRGGTAIATAPTAASTQPTTAVPQTAPVQQKATTVYTVTRSQLTGYRPMLEAKYPLWFKMLRRFNCL